MLVTIRTTNSQRKVTVDSVDQIDEKIKELFKTEKYTLFGDQERTRQIETGNIKDGMTVYMSYDMGEIKEYKEEMKCTHDPSAVCPKCVHLDHSEKIGRPDKKTKYFSYASYMQALDNKSMKPEDFDYQVKICEDHLPNQRCSKCMEKHITLVSQPYRHIDYVEFDSWSHVENFIAQWRESGRQLIGLLVGKYGDYESVPLGKKAIVSGIWEPEQESFPDGVVFDSIPTRFFSDDLQILGVIYTNLMNQNVENPTENKDRSFSTVEVNFVNDLKQKTGNPSFFGISLVFDAQKNIIPEVFMVSEQYQALVLAGALKLTTDPVLFSTHREISYRTVNEYDKIVPVKADPFLPVYYFIVNCECGFKENPMFKNNTKIKNPTVKKLAGYFDSDFGMDKFNNFNILTTLHEFVPGSSRDILAAVINNDQSLLDKALGSAEFSSFRNQMSKFENKKWSCSACTFLNEPFNESCEICGSSKQ